MWTTFTVLFALISAGPNNPKALSPKPVSQTNSGAQQGKSLRAGKDLRITLSGKSLYVPQTQKEPQPKKSSSHAVVFHQMPAVEESGETGLISRKPSPKARKAYWANIHRENPYLSRMMADRFNFKREVSQKVGRSDQHFRQAVKRK